MNRPRIAFIAVLLLAASWTVAAQVRDQPRLRAEQIGTITGRVEIEIDRQRAPVRRARVTAFAETGGKQLTTTTDIDGRYRFDRIAIGSYRIRAEKAGFVPMSSDRERATDAPALLKIGETLAVDVRMQRGAALEGRFVDDHDAAVKGLAVTADRIIATAGRTTVENSYSVITDGLGEFRLHTLPPGRYIVHALPPPPASGRELYYPGASAASEAKILSVAAGQTLDHLDFTVATAALSPIAAEVLPSRLNELQAKLGPAADPGAIEGRVLDEFGDPVPDVWIQIAQTTQVAGLPRLMPARQGTGMVPTLRTDDRGAYRMPGLPPGEYYVLALANRFNGLGGGLAASRQAETEDEAGFATTFFPGTDVANAAVAVRVVAGTNVRDVTFTLVATHTVTISGTVSDPANRPAANARLILLQTYGGEVMTMSGTTSTATETGTFTFSGVPEGTYVLQGFGLGLFGSIPVTAIATSTPAQPALSLALRPLTTARGHVSFEGGAPPQTQSGVRINFQPTDFTNGPAGGNAIVSRLSEGWDFEIPNLAWTGLVRATAPPGWTLKGVMLNGRDIIDTPYDFQYADVNGLEIVFTTRVGSVTGTVLDAGLPTTNAAIVIFSASEITWTSASRLSVTLADAQGTFTVRGLLPGRYLAVAIPQGPRGPLDSSGLAALRSFATPIEVKESIGTPLTLTIKR